MLCPILYSTTIVLMIVWCIEGEAAKTGSFDNVFEGTTDQPGQIALSFLTGMFLFGGWYAYILFCYHDIYKTFLARFEQILLANDFGTLVETCFSKNTCCIRMLPYWYIMGSVVFRAQKSAKISGNVLRVVAKHFSIEFLSRPGPTRV